MTLNFAHIFVLLKPYLSIVIAYFLGSIPTSYLIGKTFFQTDIRQSGSGNTGATNALRTLGVKAGIIVLVIDVLKGVVAVMLAKYMMSGAPSDLYYNLFVCLSALFVIIGHVFSVFLKFKGGKGVATAAGVFITLLPITFIFCIVLFVFIVAVTKYVSLGSLLAAFAFLATEIISQYLSSFPDLPRLILVTMIVALIIIRHKANIKRLMNGEENKLSFKKQVQKF